PPARAFNDSPMLVQRASWLSQPGDRLGGKHENPAAALAGHQHHTRLVRRSSNRLDAQVAVNVWLQLRLAAPGATGDTFLAQVLLDGRDVASVNAHEMPPG